MENLFGRRHQMESLLVIVVAAKLQCKNTSECEFSLYEVGEYLYLN